MKILTAASLGSNFTCSYKEMSVLQRQTIICTIISNAQKETLTLPSKRNFFILVTLGAFVFRVTVPLLASD